MPPAPQNSQQKIIENTKKGLRALPLGPLACGRWALGLTAHFVKIKSTRALEKHVLAWERETHLSIPIEKHAGKCQTQSKQVKTKKLERFCSTSLRSLLTKKARGQVSNTIKASKSN